ncbi:MAG: OmpA family protein [Gallionellaceae bacterium]|nr:OmpA family protein [Gallionellaceae bacterium]
MSRTFIITAASALSIFIAGCASPPAERVVLLPGPDGKAGAVVVATNTGSSMLLDQPYTAVAINNQGRLNAVREDAASVRARYQSALDAQPARPVSFSVFFVRGKDEITMESKPLVEKLKAEIARRPAPEIMVIGHTDRVGSDASNDILSLKRAEAMRNALVKAGIAASSISIAGRGEREPLVPTADEVAEPKNCRVEVNVR